VGPFESSVQIGSPIQVTTPIPPGTVSSLRAMTVNWTAGDEDAWVTLRVVRHWGSLRLAGVYSEICETKTQVSVFLSSCLDLVVLPAYLG
jgi:hypothetical protein